jgi:hypothetical protein
MPALGTEKASAALSIGRIPELLDPPDEGGEEKGYLSNATALFMLGPRPVPIVAGGMS